MKICTVSYCDNDLCVFAKKKKCTLNKVEINELGYCDAFVLVNIPQESLDGYKKRQRKLYP